MKYRNLFTSCNRTPKGAGKVSNIHQNLQPPFVANTDPLLIRPATDRRGHYKEQLST
jgi:hypothetical protein